MNIRIIKCFAAVSLIFFNYTGIKSQVQDSLLHYLEIATRNNPTVLQKYSEYEAALQKVPQAGGLPDPELNMGVFLSPMELISGNQVADLRLMQMFPWFGALRAAKDEMSLMANAKYEIFRDAKLQVIYDVQKTWFELFKVERNIHISERNIDILRTIERLALVRFKNTPPGRGTSPISGDVMSEGAFRNNTGISNGMEDMGNISAGNTATTVQSQPVQSMQGIAMGPAAGGSSLSDLYRIQIELGELENNTALLRNAKNTLVALFNSFLNRAPASPVVLPDSLQTKPLDVSPEAVSDSILKNNPMLGMLQYEQLSLESRKKMVTKMGYPMIGLGLNYSVINKSEMSASAMNGKDMVMPMVTLTIPVYRKKYKAMQAEADLSKSATVQNYRAFANGLNTEYYQAVQLYQDAQRRVILYNNQSKLAEKSRDIMIKSYASSGTGLTEVLNVVRQTLDYDFKQAEAIADYNNAVAWLERLMALQQVD